MQATSAVALFAVLPAKPVRTLALVSFLCKLALACEVFDIEADGKGSVTVTVTSTVFRTISHTGTVTSTVVQSIVQTTSIVETTTTTVSNLATQTDVVVVTSTVFQKRWAVAEVEDGLARPAPPVQRRHEVHVVGPVLQSIRNLLRGKEVGPEAAALQRRQVATSTVTSTVLVTSTTDVTSFATMATTIQTSSVFTTTLMQVVTR